MTQIVDGPDTTDGPVGADGVAARPRRHASRLGVPMLVLIGVLALVLVLVSTPFVLLGVAWARVGHLAVTPTSTYSGTEVFALVGLDTRAPAVNSSSARDKRIFPDAKKVPGSRADVVVLVRLGQGAPEVLTVSRDLLVYGPRGRLDRLTLQWLQSPQAFVDSLCRIGPGVPVDHVVAVDYRALVSLVDAAGGMKVDTPLSERDKRAHLKPTRPGANTLNGEQSLAWVRSRHLHELAPTGWRPATDQQQRSVKALLPLRTVADSLPWRAPWVLASLPGVGAATRTDPGVGVLDFRRLLAAMSSHPKVTELDVKETDGAIPYARPGPRAVAQVRDFIGADRCPLSSRLVAK